MLRRNVIYRDWNSMHECEKSYLRSAYRHYVNFASTSQKPCFNKAGFTEWLLKRGIHRVLAENKQNSINLNSLFVPR